MACHKSTHPCCLSAKILLGKETSFYRSANTVVSEIIASDIILWAIKTEGVLVIITCSASRTEYMPNPKNSCRPVKIVWPPAQDPHDKVLSVSKGENYSLTI